MSKSLSGQVGKMGTLPVFMTAISTILGAILFLRFGYAVAHVGFLGTIGIILIAHAVTIPTAMAVAEIATNQKVEGGGAYYMISRSFGFNIGAAIGIALFLSQAISVAFYVIAFAEAFEPALDFLSEHAGFTIYKSYIAIGIMTLLTIMMLSTGANIGMKALYVVVAVLLVSIGMFLFGNQFSTPSSDIQETIANPDSFFHVFTIIFPAFTGIAAGLGLSGDLKDPKVSIPKGTLWATVVGIVVYLLVAIKLFQSASLEDMSADQLIMSKIAIWGPIIPIGLGCAAVSSALGSIMIAPRTLQALGVDKIFSDQFSNWFARGRERDNEPVNSSVITCIIAFIFVLHGGINFVAEIISMFFMLTYGAICVIAFLEHFAADPSYRPTFKSRWYFSLMGALFCGYLMFSMNFNYAVMSVVLMFSIYIWVSAYSKDKKDGVANLFKGLIFQFSRELQVYLQKKDTDGVDDNWRPFLICITKDSFRRRSAFDMTRWLSHKYGFGTFIHFVEGYLSKETYEESTQIRERLINLAQGTQSRVFLDTIISPSYTSAIAQVIQFSGVSGKGNNLILFEYSVEDHSSLKDVINNYKLLRATNFNVCILRSTFKGFGYHKEMHVWLSPKDYENANLMILIAYIMLGHPEWRKGTIKIFSIYPVEEFEVQKTRLLKLISTGRLPISSSNVELIAQPENMDMKSIISKKSEDADLTVLGYSGDMIEQDQELFTGYEDLGNILFVSAMNEIRIS